MDSVLPILHEEVLQGWNIILPLAATSKIPGLCLAPIGLVQQTTIDAQGSLTDKLRFTHDLTFEVIPDANESFNHRLDKTALSPLIYGNALPRLIHHIINLRRIHPNQPIFLTKVDWKAAYRRLHNDGDAAVQSGIIVPGFLLIALRLTFRGAHNPSRWSDLSELANDLVLHPSWDPTVQQSPHQALIPVDPEPHPNPTVPFAPAQSTLVPLPVRDHPRADVFLDDTFMAFITRDSIRARSILPFVIHLLSRPIHASETLQRSDPLSLTKFTAEATPSERKLVLGWLIVTRALSISLPAPKVLAWKRQIQTCLSKRIVPLTDWQQLLGRLHHAASIIHLAQHFLDRFYAALTMAQRRHSPLSVFPKTSPWT